MQTVANRPTTLGSFSLTPRGTSRRSSPSDRAAVQTGGTSLRLWLLRPGSCGKRSKPGQEGSVMLKVPRRRGSSGCAAILLLSLSLSRLQSEEIGLSGEPILLPGPALDLPVDVDGDGVVTFGDQFVLNYWLEQGGSLADALLSAKINDKVIGLAAFFESQIVATATDGSVQAPSAGAPARPGGAGPQGGGIASSLIDFTRGIPPDVVLNLESRHIRATPDGKFFVFSSKNDFLGLNPPPGVLQVYRVQVSNIDVSTIDLCSRTVAGAVAPADCLHPSISDDGLVVSFDTPAALDPARDTNGTLSDVYVSDFRVGGPVTRLKSSPSAAGFSGNRGSYWSTVSGDGTVVVFTSKASNLSSPPGPVDIENVYLVGTNAAATPSMQIISVDDVGNLTPCGGAGGDCSTYDPVVGGGKVVNFTGTRVVFQGSPKNPPNPPGNAFALQQTGLTSGCSQSPFPNRQIFLRDRSLGRTFLVSAIAHASNLVNCGFGDSLRPSISGDGGWIVFQSVAPNLVISDTNGVSDVFRVNTLELSPTHPNLLTPLRVSLAIGVVEVFGASGEAMITSDGKHVAFVSESDDLDPDGDTNGAKDVFVRHIDSPTLLVVTTLGTSKNCQDDEGVGAPPELLPHSVNPDVFLGGRAVVYESDASNLLVSSQDFPFYPPSPDTNNVRDVFETRLKPRFVRGDANSDGFVDVSDPIFLLNAHQVAGAPPPECLDAADPNDDASLDISDPIYLLNFLFQGTAPPLYPFPECDFDPTDDCISCRKRGISCLNDHSPF